MCGQQTTSKYKQQQKQQQQQQRHHQSMDWRHQRQYQHCSPTLKCFKQSTFLSLQDINWTSMMFVTLFDASLTMQPPLSSDATQPVTDIHAAAPSSSLLTPADETTQRSPPSAMCMQSDNATAPESADQHHAHRNMNVWTASQQPATLPH